MRSVDFNRASLFLRKTYGWLVLFCCISINTVLAQTFRDAHLPIDDRVNLLIDSLTIDEKISLMVNNSGAVERLDIPEYNWWNEALHGVARSTPATVFPQAIGMAATFDPDLIYRVATVISDEGRAIYNESTSKGIHKWYMGLTYWSPNVNIFRDPRWGRGHETYGEDPYLAGLLGASFVRGLQGNDEKYLKTAAGAKHFLVHNGPEENRFTFDATASRKDLYETYLPAFQALIDADVAGVMCAYNKLNSESCCGSYELLTSLLREEMGFDGYIVSDCGAINNLHATHKTTTSLEESAALALKAGVNVNCGGVYSHLKKSIEQGLVTESVLNKALARQLEVRFRLGMFDNDEDNPYTKISIDKVHAVEHIDLAREAAQKSIVLLKNSPLRGHDRPVLPLEKDIGQIYVTGNNAADVNVLLGNYYGISSNLVTVLEGIAGAISPTTILQYNQGFLVEQDVDVMKSGQIWNATNADVTIAIIGLNPLFEGENGDTPFSTTGGDRKTIELPSNQVEYLRLIKEKIGNKPLIVVVMSGSAIAMPEVHDLADAIIWAWYPGEQGGNAVADVLFGKYSPSGKLPVTIYRSTEQLGDFEDYSIAAGGRTYKYFTKKPLYPFGFGLTYNDLEYELIGSQRRNMKASEQIKINVQVSNNGTFTQNEALQLYVSRQGLEFTTPLFALKGISNYRLEPGESTIISFQITSKVLEQVNDDGKAILPRGEYSLYIGTSSPTGQSVKLGVDKPFEVLINLE